MTDPAFFEASRRFTAGEISALTGAELRTPERAGYEVTRLASTEESGAGALVFVEGKKNASRINGIAASVLICSEDLVTLPHGDMAVLVSRNPQRDFATVGRLMYPNAARPAPMTGETGISPAAHIHADASVEKGAIIEANVVVGPGAAIGAGTIVAPNAVIGAGSQIGRDCYIGAGATIQNSLIGNRVIIHPGARIGQDGFGFALGKSGPEKIPQIGRVVIQDDVEIGANTTIDRGALTDTVIGEATKIDNLVQIAHNVRIGRGCIIAGNSGLSGSVTLGDGALLGGRVGIADHLTIGARAQVAAGSGLMHDVPAGERWGGFPAQPLKDTMREIATLRAMARANRAKGKKDG